MSSPVRACLGCGIILSMDARKDLCPQCEAAATVPDNASPDQRTTPRPVKRKIGAFVPAHNNPYFLRHIVLQIMIQTQPPDVLVIHQNNHPEDYLWVIDDLVGECRRRSIDLHNIFNPVSQPIQRWDCVGLMRCLDCDCDYIFKFDHDDLYRIHHIETLLAHLEGGFDFVANRTAGLLLLKKSEPFEYFPDMDFSEFNPIQCMSSSIAFNREFGKAILEQAASLGDEALVIDDLIRDYVMARFANKVHRIESATPTSIYVCYGGNVSTCHWIEQEQHLIEPAT